MAKCRLCNRKPQKGSDFCRYHMDAYDSLKKNYGSWLTAYGQLSWKEYLEKLLKTKETGKWIKEVIKLELQEKKKEG